MYIVICIATHKAIRIIKPRTRLYMNDNEGQGYTCSCIATSKDIHIQMATHEEARTTVMLGHINIEMNTTEMMAMSFMTMLSAGPEVSFSGSPTVSPTTAAE